MRLALTILALFSLVLAVQGQQIHRNPFEARTPVWQKGAADMAFQEQVHEVTTQAFHTGQQSEHIQITAEQGAHVYYVYPIGRAEAIEELTISVWLRGNRPGMQLAARLVLPRERDPGNLDQPLTTLLRGDRYRVAGRWQRLEIRQPHKLALEQQELMRAELKREVNFDGAYIDQLMINVYGGKGLNEVWIDDLEMGPIVGEVFQPAKQGNPRGLVGGALASNALSGGSGGVPRQAKIRLNQDRLQVNNRPFFVRAIRHSDTPLKVLRDAGFNTIWFDFNTKEETLQEAVQMGFWLAPDLPVLTDNPRLEVPGGLSREVARYPLADAVIFWHVGTGLAWEQAAHVARASQAIRGADAGQPVAADVWDGFRRYSRSVDMIGVHRWPLLTSLELASYREWLRQRIDLAEPGTYVWTWVQTHLPEWYCQLVHEQSSSEPFEDPIGPQPEQIRLLTYLALSAGSRGLGFWSDRFLANSHQGRDRLLALAILNQELEMLDPMLATVKNVNWIDTKNKEVKAAVLRYEGGVLVLPIWVGRGAQYVPGQMAANNIEIVVPGAPRDAQVWEVSPGDVRTLRHERVAGGTRVHLPEFGLTSAIVFTSDVNATDGGTIGRLQQAARRTQRLAAQWSYELGLEELRKVEKVNAQLEELGHGQPDGRQLLDEARKHLASARELWTRGGQTDYKDAYAEAQRALRPMRILMRAQWEEAAREIDAPIASPYAVSYFTLPHHWRLVDEVKRSLPLANAIQHGDFELPPGIQPESWSLQQETLDDEYVQLAAERVADQPREGRQCLRLTIRAKNPDQPPAALERTFLALNSPQVKLQPGTLVRISGWARIPEPIQASVDGALLFDSIGGEPLAVRLTGKMPWKKFTLYRRVPASGMVNVTVALTGVGTVYFDDLRIEPLHPQDG